MAVDFEDHMFTSSSDKTFSSTSSDKTSLSQELFIDCHSPINEMDNDIVVLETNDNTDGESPLTEYSDKLTSGYSIDTSLSVDTPDTIIITTPGDNIDLEIIVDNNNIQKQFIAEHITNDDNYLFNKYLCQMDHPSTFNIITKFHQGQIAAISSSNGWNKGIHEWRFQILQCEISYQEIGVVSVNQNIHMDSRGIVDSEHFEARAIFGNIRKRSLIVYGYIRKHKPFYPQEIINIINNFACEYYYASYDSDGSERCFKYLSQNNNWKLGDIIGVRVNLNKWKIQFYLNGEQVRKDMSLERDHMYYPIIAFCGDCEYKLMHFE